MLTTKRGPNLFDPKSTGKWIQCIFASKMYAPHHSIKGEINRPYILDKIWIHVWYMTYDMIWCNMTWHDMWHGHGFSGENRKDSTLPANGILWMVPNSMKIISYEDCSTEWCAQDGKNNVRHITNHGTLSFRRHLFLL